MAVQGDHHIEFTPLLSDLKSLHIVWLRLGEPEQAAAVLRQWAARLPSGGELREQLGRASANAVRELLSQRKQSSGGSQTGGVTPELETVLEYLELVSDLTVTARAIAGGGRQSGDNMAAGGSTKVLRACCERGTKEDLGAVLKWIAAPLDSEAVLNGVSCLRLLRRAVAIGAHEVAVQVRHSTIQLSSLYD